MKAAIVGTGILGRLLGLALLEQGWNITLFDSDSKKGTKSCSYSAAGMLSPIYELEKSEPWIYDMGILSINLWPKIIAKLPQTIFFQKKGTLVIAHSELKNRLNYFIKNIYYKKFNNKYIKYLSPDELKLLEPELNHDVSAFHFTEEAHIDSQTLLSSFTDFFAQQRIVWKDKVLVKKISSGKVEYLDKVEKFDWVFDCRGLGAKKEIMELRGVRGELIWLHAPEVNLRRPIRLLHPRYPLYLIPRPGHIYLVGASEIENENNFPITVRTLLELLSAAYSIHKGFAQATLLKTIVNLRPTFLNHLPKIFFQKGLCVINGLYRHGYLISPAIVKEVISLIHYGKNKMKFPQLLGKNYDSYYCE